MKRYSPSEFYWHGTSFSEIMSLLPFERQRAEEVDDRSDIIKFCSPFALPSFRLLLANGTQVTAPTLAESAEEIVAMFHNYVETNLSDFCQKCKKQFFDKEVYAEIGMAMKYPFALHILHGALYSENELMVVWVPTHDEAVRGDFECAFFLCANCYYKQALQVLRSVIELAVAHGYFLLDAGAFERWEKDPDYRLPPVRGRGSRGMLHKLRQSGWINDRIFETGYDLYGRLNGCVHATVGRMGGIRGVMDVEKLKEFYTFSSHVGDFVINLTLHLLLLNSEPQHIDDTDDIPFE